MTARISRTQRRKQHLQRPGKMRRTPSSSPLPCNEPGCPRSPPSCHARAPNPQSAHPRFSVSLHSWPSHQKAKTPHPCSLPYPPKPRIRMRPPHNHSLPFSSLAQTATLPEPGHGPARGTGSLNKVIQPATLVLKLPGSPGLCFTCSPAATYLPTCQTTTKKSSIRKDPLLSRILCPNPAKNTNFFTSPPV